MLCQPSMPALSPVRARQVSKPHLLGLALSLSRSVSASVGGVMVDEPKAKKSRRSAAVVKLSAHRVSFYRLFSHN